MATSSYFTLFELPLAFEIDLEQLAARYRELARSLHPDRVAEASEGKRRQALERAVQLNDAYQTLKTPPLRARHLLALQGHEMDLEATIQDPSFLLQQLEWREELEALQEAANLSGIAAFKTRLNQSQQALGRDFAPLWQDPAQRQVAEQLVRRMQFLDKLSLQVRQLEERLDD